MVEIGETMHTITFPQVFYQLQFHVKKKNKVKANSSDKIAIPNTKPNQCSNVLKISSETILIHSVKHLKQDLKVVVESYSPSSLTELD